MRGPAVAAFPGGSCSQNFPEESFWQFLCGAMLEAKLDSTKSWTLYLSSSGVDQWTISACPTRSCERQKNHTNQGWNTGIFSARHGGL